VAVLLLGLQACGDGDLQEQRIVDLEAQLEEVLSQLEAATSTTRPAAVPTTTTVPAATTTTVPAATTTTVPGTTTTTDPWGLSGDQCEATGWIQFTTC